MELMSPSTQSVIFWILSSSSMSLLEPTSLLERGYLRSQTQVLLVEEEPNKYLEMDNSNSTDNLSSGGRRIKTSFQSWSKW